MKKINLWVLFILSMPLFLVACGSSSTSVGNGVYTVSGTVTSSGVALSGATVTFTGTSSGTATTDSNGKYSFTGVNNGVYQITVTKTGYVAPASLMVTVTNADATGKDFTVTQATYNIAGTVTSGGAGLAGVTVSLSGATIATITATTDTDGKYSIAVVNGSYTLTAVKAGYLVYAASISPTNVKVADVPPSNLAVTVNNADVTGQDFTAILASYTVSGTITASGAPLSGATVTLSGTSSGTTTTDTNGNYSFSVHNGSYTLTPTLPGYIFAPVSLSPAVSNANATGQDFTATEHNCSSGCSDTKLTTGVTTTVPNIAPPGVQNTTFNTNAIGPFNYVVHPFTVDITGTYSATSITPDAQNTTFFLTGLFTPGTPTPTPLSNFIVSVYSGNNSPLYTANITTLSLVAGQQYTVLVPLNVNSPTYIGHASTVVITGPGFVTFN